MTNYNVANQTELNTALGLAVGGDTITLTSWSGGMTFSSRSYASDVTIIGTGITVGQITIADCDHLAFQDLTSRMAAGSGTNNAIFSGNSTYVTFDSVDFGRTGQDSFDSWDDFAGASVGNTSYCINVPSGATCDNMTVVDSTLGGATVPIRIFDSDNTTIERCTFETVRTDCIKFGGTGSGIEVRDCLFPRLRWFKESTEHSDCFQIVGSYNNVEIHGNVFLPKVSISTQGFYHDNGTSNNVNISQNVMGNYLKAMEFSGSNHSATNNTCFCYAVPGGTISASEIYLTSSKNFTGTWKASLAGVKGSNILLCSEGDGSASSPYRPWDQYDIATGKRNGADFPFSLDLDDLDPVTDSLADYAAQGAGTYGAYDTISRIAANGYAWPPGAAATPEAPTILAAPTISGTERVGATLTAVAGGVTGTPTPTRTWQWYNSVSGPIAGATNSTYVLQASDEGDTVSVTQIETNASDSDSESSAATGTIAAALSAPTISSTNPTDNATGVAIDTVCSITFNKNIAFGPSGVIGLHRPDATPTLRETWNVAVDLGTGPGQLSISGATLTIRDSSVMLADKDYWFEIPSGAVEGTDGSVFGGINDSTTWNFATSDAPPSVSHISLGGGAVLHLNGFALLI